MTSSPAARDARNVLTWTIIIGLIAFIVVVLRGNVALSDPDTQWHIATGRLIMETGALPRVDTMSHTHAGQPWIAKEWLSQVILYLAWMLGGWTGVMALTAIGLALTAAVIAHHLLRSMTPGLTLAIVWIVIGSLLSVTVARPHVLAFGVMALFTLLLVKASERDQSPPWLALPLMALWANLHAAFTLGFVIAACMGLDALLRAAPERRARLAGLWLLFGLGLLAAACLHPYGVQSILINIDMMRGNESVPLIIEWDPHPLLQPVAARLYVPALMLATLLAAPRANAGRILLAAFMLYLTLKHQRFAMMLVIVTPLLCRDTLAAAVRAALKRFNLFQREDPLSSDTWRKPIAAGFAFAFAALPFIADRAELPRIAAPSAALAAVPAELRAQPVYNSYNFGGFLVMNGVPTFIDGRTDQLFTTNFMGPMHQMIRRGDREAFIAFIERYGPRWALVQVGFDDQKMLADSPHWKETYADDIAKVYVRVGG